MITLSTFLTFLLPLFLQTAANPGMLDRAPNSSPEDLSSLLQARVAGGWDITDPGDVPWHFQFRYGDVYKCGAALILTKHGNQVILTAAQCVKKKGKPLSKYQMSVFGGRVKRNGVHYYEQVREVEKVTIHEDHHPTYTWDYYDIAILHLDRPFRLDAFVQPLPLVDDKRRRPEGEIIISGWGYTDPDEKGYSDWLQVGTVEFINNGECDELMAQDSNIHATIQDHHFCAGKARNPTYQGGCTGDVGGPAVNVYNNTMYLVGLFDWSKSQCGNRYYPSVFMDLAQMITWIEKHSYPLTSRSARRQSDPEVVEALRRFGYDIVAYPMSPAKYSPSRKRTPEERHRQHQQQRKQPVMVRTPSPPRRYKNNFLRWRN